MIRMILIAAVLVTAVGCKEEDSLPRCVSDQKKATEGISDVDALAACLALGLDFTQFEDPQASCEKYAHDHDAGASDADITAACVIVLTPPPDAAPEPDAAGEDASPFDASPFDAPSPDGA